MTNQEALKLLNDMEFAEKYQGKQEYADMLLLCNKALEKQVPKKPIDTELFIYASGTRTLSGYCPVCDQPVSIFDGHQNNKKFRRDEDVFCSYCGQALDWSE